MVSKGGLEPPRPFERQPLKLVRLPISPLRRVGDAIYAFASLHEEHAERNNGEQPYETDRTGDAIEILLGCSRTKRRGSAATEHVTQATTATAVQQNANHHADQRENVDDQGDGNNH